MGMERKEIITGLKVGWLGARFMVGGVWMEVLFGCLF